MTDARLPHSDTLGSQLGWQLPEAYRSLPRPSSAPDAKTSTACPYTLTTRTIKMLASTMHFSKNNHAKPPETRHPNNRQQHTSPEKTTHQHPRQPHPHNRSGHLRAPTRPVPSGPNSVPHP